MSNISIWPIDNTLSGVTTPGQSEPGSNGNEGVLYISQSSKIRDMWSDCLVSYREYLMRGGGQSYPSEEMHSVYFIAPADWAGRKWEWIMNFSKYIYIYIYIDHNKKKVLF